MSSYKTNVTLLEYSSVAEAKLIEYVVNVKVSNIDKFKSENLRFEIKKSVLRDFFKKIATEKCIRYIDCNIKAKYHYGNRYIGEAASIKDSGNASKDSTSHKAVIKGIGNKLGNGKGQIIYIIQKIMCQILPAYLHYKLEVIIGEENIKCYYGSAEYHKDNKGQYKYNIGNITKAIEFMTNHGWISSAERVEGDLINYGLLIYQIEFDNRLVSWFKKNGHQPLNEDFYVEYQSYFQT